MGFFLATFLLGTVIVIISGGIRVWFGCGNSRADKHYWPITISSINTLRDRSTFVRGGTRHVLNLDDLTLMRDASS